MTRGKAGSIFVEGPPGSGKQAYLLQHIADLISDGAPPYSLLVLLPDRPARERLRQALAAVLRGRLGGLELHTYYSLAQRMVALFWPLIAPPAGFAHSSRPPTFLTYETAQHLMSRIVEPLLEQGYFEGLATRRQRLLSQLLDNLNKAAINGFSHTEIGTRLSAAWSGDDDRRRSYRQAQTCADRFRQHCLDHNLLDVSLTIEAFHRYLVEDPVFWNYFTGRYRHLVAANVEETVPVAQDLARRLLPVQETALLTHETGGGYRVFLGIDSAGARRLADACQQQETLPPPPDANAHLLAFALALGQRWGRGEERSVAGQPAGGDHQAAHHPGAVPQRDDCRCRRRDRTAGGRRALHQATSPSWPRTPTACCASCCVKAFSKHRFPSACCVASRACGRTPSCALA